MVERLENERDMGRGSGSDPAFSVVMPAYNRAYCIRAAIDSLLRQSYRRFELVIADGGSTDETEGAIKANYGEEISSGRIVYLKLAHRGVCHARNAALRRTVAEWIAYLDTDNVVSEDFLATFADGIRSNPQSRNFYAALVYRQSRRVLDRPFNRRTLARGNFIDMGVYCHHRNLIAEFGEFDQEVAGLEDWDLILRHTAKYTPVRLGRIVLNYQDGNYQDGRRSDRLSSQLKLGKAHDIIHARYWNGARPTEEEVRLVSQSHFFDAEWYRATYGDRLNGMEPAEHYLSVGWLDNMAPGPLFDGVGYMGHNPDIASALVNPLLHYERYGRKEGRTGFLRTKVEAVKSARGMEGRNG